MCDTENSLLKRVERETPPIIDEVYELESLLESVDEQLEISVGLMTGSAEGDFDGSRDQPNNLQSHIRYMKDKANYILRNARTIARELGH